MTSDTESSTYKIGKVSRLTGVSPDTLRIWERRYKAVVPQRSDSGGRLYSSEDIARLKLMKSLVDAGDSISSVAGLSREALETRSSESQESLVPQTPDGPFRITVIGEQLASRIDRARAQLDYLDLYLLHYGPFPSLASRDPHAISYIHEKLYENMATA